MIVVHCIFCPFTVESTTSEGAHSAMETHYNEKHGEDIKRMLAEMPTEQTR